MATLKSLVDETTNIKNSIVSNRNTLKQILIDKKIKDISSVNSLSVLISNVSKLEGFDNTLYMYKEGVEHSLTGGINKITLRNTGGSVTCTKNATNLHAEVVSPTYTPTVAGFCTINKIDLSQYSRLYFQTSLSYTLDYSNYLGVLKDDKSTSNTELPDRYVSYVRASAGDSIVTTLNISSLSGSYYICGSCGFNKSTINLTIHRIWLEK